MKKERATLAVASILAATTVLQPFQASAEAACSKRILNIVAHHDDDLLFLNPNLIHDINAGYCVQTVFLVASDYPDIINDGFTRPIDPDQYMAEREAGVREAYAKAAGVEDDWSSETYNANGKLATQWTLNERISIVEVRISDASTDPGNRLWWLYALNQSVTTRDGTTFNRQELGDFLRQVTQNFSANEIHAGDPLADHRTTAFHTDHLATARLVRWALDGRVGGPPVEAYRDYSISEWGPNLSDEEVTAKTEMFQTFVRHDYDICHTGPGTECAPDDWQNSQYNEWMTRQYYVDQNWREGFVEPLPVSYNDNNRAGPYIRGRYQIRNVATGQELAILNASQEDEAEVITWSPTGTPNQTFELRATPGGWEMSPLHSKDPNADRWKCLDVPGSSQTSGQHVIQYGCTGNPNEALQVIRQPAGNYELVFSHSKMRLTAPAGLGGNVTQTYYDGSNYQKWTLVPA